MILRKGSIVHHKTYNKNVEVVAHYSGDVYRVKVDGLTVFATLWIDLVP